MAGVFIRIFRTSRILVSEISNCYSLKNKVKTGQHFCFSTSTPKILRVIHQDSILRQRCYGNNDKNTNISVIRRRKSSVASTSKEDVNVVAKIILDSSENVLVMVGAGISTPSGVPDFRSPGTGLYHNLQKYNLPYPEAIFDIQYFMMDPRPFFSLAQDLYPGVNYQPNAAHYFIRLLHDEGKLQKVYTQNIDGLERVAGIPSEKLMEAHGTFSSASCTLCGQKHDAEGMKQAILNDDVPVICGASKVFGSGKCKGKVKPDIVFFGENLPEDFWNYHNDICFTKLLLVIGTSLEVYPFAGIAEAVGNKTPRVLINRDVVGSFGRRKSDVTMTGDLEDRIWDLVQAIGWKHKLEKLVEENQIHKEE